MDSSESALLLGILISSAASAELDESEPPLEGVVSSHSDKDDDLVGVMAPLVDGGEFLLASEMDFRRGAENTVHDDGGEER